MTGAGARATAQDEARNASRTWIYSSSRLDAIIGDLDRMLGELGGEGGDAARNAVRRLEPLQERMQLRAVGRVLITRARLRKERAEEKDAVWPWCGAF